MGDEMVLKSSAECKVQRGANLLNHYFYRKGKMKYQIRVPRAVKLCTLHSALCTLSLRLLTNRLLSDEDLTQ